MEPAPEWAVCIEVLLRAVGVYRGSQATHQHRETTTFVPYATCGLKAVGRLDGIHLCSIHLFNRLAVDERRAGRPRRKRAP